MHQILWYCLMAAITFVRPGVIRMNMPLQVMVMLNDSVYLDAVKYFACRMQTNALNVHVHPFNIYSRNRIKLSMFYTALA